ncbi:hypothetical protein [Pendulispora albinea]|uniref:Uncharacterized protein n=1 Tax=Pendulispora albinea TaxID=2741071 RepID=A0ABZ2LYF7_9BACT
MKQVSIAPLLRIFDDPQAEKRHQLAVTSTVHPFIAFPDDLFRKLDLGHRFCVHAHRAAGNRRARSRADNEGDVMLPCAPYPASITVDNAGTARRSFSRSSGVISK